MFWLIAALMTAIAAALLLRPLLRADDITMFPVRDPVASIVMQGGVGNVDTVLVAGKVTKRGGKLVHPGLAELKAALRRSGDRILADFGYQARTDAPPPKQDV